MKLWKVSRWQKRDSIALEQKAAIETYNVKVKTGDKFGCGTNANVYMQLFGEENDSGMIQVIGLNKLTAGITLNP